MKVGVLKETLPGERRVALVPDVVGKIRAAGADVLVETGAGITASFPDVMYTDAGATVVSAEELYAHADVLLKVQKPTEVEVGRLRSGQEPHLRAVAVGDDDLIAGGDRRDAFGRQPDVGPLVLRCHRLPALQ